MNIELTLHEQRKRLNQIYDILINNNQLTENQFDKAMKEWIVANKRLEVQEEVYDAVLKIKYSVEKYQQAVCLY